MNMNIDGKATAITVRDVVFVENDVPTHQGLEFEVETEADSVDEAVQLAGRNAETVASLLSAAARAPVEPLDPSLAYDITQARAERVMVQWFDATGYPVGKTPVPSGAFGFLFERFPAAEERVAQRLRLSIDWHRAALRATDALFRFVAMWPALESVGNPISEHYSLPAHGWQGLRRLAQDEGHSSGIISEMLDIRRHLFHDLSVRPADVRPRAAAVLPVMEQLVVAAWVRLLGDPAQAVQFPTSAVTPHPIKQVIRVLLIDEDASRWGNGIHPHFEGRLVPTRVPPERPGAVTVTFSTELQPRNIENWRPVSVQLWGPSGPNPPTVENVSHTFSDSPKT
jgi:hypothetical protein